MTLNIIAFTKQSEHPARNYNQPRNFRSHKLYFLYMTIKTNSYRCNRRQEKPSADLRHAGSKQHCYVIGYVRMIGYAAM